MDNTDKFKKVLHYVIDRCNSLDSVGKTVLFKILYFIDFDYFELNEKSLTGETYRRIPMGPAPINFDSIHLELEREGKVQLQERKYLGGDQKKSISLKSPDMSGFTAEEINFINKKIAEYGGYTASQIKARSHKDMPCKATELMHDIDYKLVFYRDPEFSVREYPKE